MPLRYAPPDEAEAPAGLPARHPPGCPQPAAEAAEFQGGVGTAGSANIGKKYAMFEAVHGSAPRMIKEGRGQYADPCSMLRASVMLLSHIGFQKQANALEAALDKCMLEEKKLVITGRADGCTCSEFGDYVMETITQMTK